MRFAETLTSVNETDFGDTTDFVLSPESSENLSEKGPGDPAGEKSEVSNTENSDMDKKQGSWQTGWEGWDDQDEWKEAKKIELNTDIKITESKLPETISSPETVFSETDQTDTEGGYETAREGTETETEAEKGGNVTESEAFFSADEDMPIEQSSEVRVRKKN